MKRPSKLDWSGIGVVPSQTFVCGYCGNLVASDRGWNDHNGSKRLRACGECSGVTLFFADQQVPGSSYGNSVRNLPPEIDKLYEEARSAVSNGAPTAAVLCCRKVLMHVAVDKEAEEGKTFENYVSYLSDKNFIPAGAREWVDQIRKQGNEANHEIVLKSREDARELIDFVEMLLKVVYEYPARVKSKTS